MVQAKHLEGFSMLLQFTTAAQARTVAPALVSEFLSIKFFTSFIVLIIPLQICSQNLIRNGSFEEISECPNYTGQIDRAIGWINTNGITPDLFHNCSSYNLIEIPTNYMGYEYPRTGDAFALLGATKGDGVMWMDRSEYISSEIIQMEEKVLYNLEFYLSLAEKSRFYTDKFGVYFSSHLPPSSYSEYSSLSPIYYSYGILNVSSGWQKVEIIIEGNLNYEYITIGFFEFPPNLALNNPQAFVANTLAYYIDDISLYPVEYHPNFQDTFLCLPEKLELKAPYYPDMSYRWYFESQWLSDSSSLYVENPATGWYVLHYTDFRNDSYIDSAYVEIIDCGSVQLPNVFTPNGDGVHDVWAPITKDIDQLEIEIFNRWGKLVHQYSGPAYAYSGWDGGDSPDGSYFVVVKAKGNTGRVMEEKGTITLLR